MAIAFVNSAFSTSSGTAGTSKTISYTPTAGNTLIVFAFGSAVAAVSATDTLNNLYVLFVPHTANTVEVTTFVCRQCNGGATTITINFASSTKNTCAVVEYSGALEVGLKNTGSGSSTGPTVAITTEDANNFVVAGMAIVGTETWAASVGNLRQSQPGASASTPGGAVTDNTAVSPGAVTNTTTLSSSGAWVAHAVELRTVLQQFLTDQNLDYYNQAAMPPWKIGNLKLYAEDEQFSWGYLFDTKMSIDNERFDQPPIQVSYFGLGDDEVIQQLCLGLSEYQHIPDEPIPQQTSILFDDVDTESEQFMFNPPLAGTGANLMGYRGFWSLRAGMGSEVDNFAFNPPVPVAISGFDEDEGPPTELTYLTLDTESEQFMFNPPLAGTGANLMGFRGFWSLRAGMGSEIDNFAFDLPQQFDEDQFIVPIAIMFYPGVDDDTTHNTFFAMEEYPDDFYTNPLWPLIFANVDNESEQFMFNLVVGGAGTTVMGFRGWSLRAGMGSEIDNFGFNPVVIATAITPFDFDQQPLVALVVVQEDEQVYPASPFLTPIGFDEPSEQVAKGWAMQDDVDTFGYLISQEFAEIQEFGPAQQNSIVSEIEDESAQVYPNPPFLTPFQSDDAPEHLSSKYLVWDDVEQQNFVETFVLDDQATPLSTTRVAQEDEQFSYNPVVVSTITPFDDDQQLYKQLWMYDDTDVFGYLVSQTFAEVHEFGPVQSQSVVSEDEYFGYNTVVVGAITPFDDDQQLPRMLQVTDDDQVWGFKTPVVVNPFEDDQQIPLLGRVVDEDGAWGYNTVVVAAITPFDEDQYAVQAARVVDDDTNWGYNPAVITAITPFDQDYVLPAVQSIFDGDMEQFGQDQVFVQDDYQNPMVVYPVVQDDDLFGKDVTFAAVLDDNPLVPASDVDDVDQFGYQFVFAPELDQHPLQPRPLVDDVEMYGSNPTFISEVWESYGVPPSPPFLYQQDVEIWGYKFPIAYPSSTMEDFQTPQFPVWSLAWDEGWEVQPTIIPFTFKIPIVYKVQNVPLLNMTVRSGLALSVRAISNQLRLVSEPPETGYGVGGYGAVGYGGGSIGTGVQVSGGPRLLVGSVSTFARLTIQGITVQ